MAHEILDDALPLQQASTQQGVDQPATTSPVDASSRGSVFLVLLKVVIGIVVASLLGLVGYSLYSMRQANEIPFEDVDPGFTPRS